MKASCTPCEKSVTVSFSGNRVAVELLVRAPHEDLRLQERVGVREYKCLAQL
jgi:hypothetical protein